MSNITNTIDITTLPNYGTLPAGTYTISAVAKGTGTITSSNKSTGVSYTKAAGKQVTISSSMAPYDYSIYDGQNTSGILLGSGDGTYDISSGYIYLKNNRAKIYGTGTCSGGVTYVSTSGSQGVLYSVSGDGAITGVNFGCFVKGTKITLADYSTKNVEDITYDDELLVWNFYDGKLDKAKPIWIMEARVAPVYKKVLLSDGTILKLVGEGEKCHRLFNITKQQMIYANECVGDEVYKQDGSIVKVESCEIIEEQVEFYNLTTEKYLDCFANGVLTGSRLNNMYHISNMKYDSDERLISKQEENDRWAVRGMDKPQW